MLALANGQVPATAGTILAGTTLLAEGRVDACFTNVGGAPETLVVTVKRNGGTARRVARFVLQANETAYVCGFVMEPSDTLLAVTSNATSVDYTVDLSTGGPLRIFSCDANGAERSGAAAIGSGSLTITGDLTVSGGDIDAGASGTAGTVDIFPSTASKGKTQFTATDNTGDTTTTITNAAQATTRTYTIPDALASAQFILGAQAAVARTATADGLTTGTIADAGRLQHITVTSADANNIIVLPTPTPGHDRCTPQRRDRLRIENGHPSFCGNQRRNWRQCRKRHRRQQYMRDDLRLSYGMERVLSGCRFRCREG